MPDSRLSVAKLAYREAIRATDFRSDNLNDFRQRAASILTVAVLLMAFFGQAIGPDLEALSWLAVIAFFGVLAFGVAISWPRRKKKNEGGGKENGWRFGLDPVGILDGSKPDMTEATVIEEAARSLADLLPETDERLDRLALWLSFQWGALGFEVFFWTLDLAGR